MPSQTQINIGPRSMSCSVLWVVVEVLLYLFVSLLCTFLCELVCVWRVGVMLWSLFFVVFNLVLFYFNFLGGHE